MKKLKSCIAVTMSVLMLSTMHPLTAFAIEETPETTSISSETTTDETITDETSDLDAKQDADETTKSDATDEENGETKTAGGDASDAKEGTAALTDENDENTEIAGETSEDADETEKMEEEEDELSDLDLLEKDEESDEDKTKKDAYEVIYFNTGSRAQSVIPAENAEDDPYAYTFDSEGRFNIPIDEGNPFFPYQVQFSVGDSTWNEWFMTPDSTVNVNGHTFGVELNDGKYSSITLHVGGRDIVVYPKEKTFTSGLRLLMSKSMSLMPLTEKELDNVDLTGFSPLELTMVSTTAIFAGEEISGDKIVWSRIYNDDKYTISNVGDTVNLSCNTYYGNTNSYEMIVGEADQLALTNTRYIVPIKVTASKEWFSGSAAYLNDDGTKTALTTSSLEYSDYDKDDRRIYFYTSAPTEWKADQKFYISLSNGNIFTAPTLVKFFEGKYSDAVEAASGKDITDLIWNTDSASPNQGYEVQRKEFYTGSYYTYGTTVDITMVSYDSSGNVTGCLPFTLNLYPYNSSSSPTSDGDTTSDGDIRINGLYSSSESTSVYTTYSSTTYADGTEKATFKLYKEFPASGTYKVSLSYDHRDAGETSSISANDKVIGAYEGNYDSNEAALAASAIDIKNQLFSSTYGDGYAASYGDGKEFSIFAYVGTEVKKFPLIVAVEETNESIYRKNSATLVTFTGLVDEDGNSIPKYVLDGDMDSYGDYSYRTIIVDSSVDLTNVAPTFTTAAGVSLYGVGSTKKIESGKDYRDFSDGKVQQYTASSEDKEFQTNYWLQVVQANSEVKLYINSFGDEEAEVTSDSDGVIRAKREVILDSRSSYKHDIIVINMGTTDLKNVKAELNSDTLAIDEYWTLSGNHDLSAYTGITKPTYINYGELPNLARIRLAKKTGVEDGADVSGTLTLSSAGKTIAVLTLTGTVGDPIITTKTIPDAVKYVHYGTMIMNNNKYKWNTTSYTLEGNLPAGLSLMPNGEIYGVPTEAGEFTFKITMNNSAEFDSSSREYTLKVAENNDEDVEKATSENYYLEEKIPDFDGVPDKAYTFVSHGEYSEFTVKQEVRIDGEKLTPGTDYSSESGSTRITIFAQTLAKGKGTHTISVEFRNAQNDFNRAAQNYHIKSDAKSSSGGGNSSSSSSSSSSGSSSTGAAGTNKIANSPISFVKNAATLGGFEGMTNGAMGTLANGNVALAEGELEDPQIQAVFTAFTPAGFTQIMTFSLVVDKNLDYNQKNGSLVLDIKKDLVQEGRTFALIGVDRYGQPHIFEDKDASDLTITTDISMEGFAFALIYSDTVKSPVTTAPVGTSEYIVKKGDTLSKIARKVGTTVDALVKLNSITNPNKIRIDQTLVY